MYAKKINRINKNEHKGLKQRMKPKRRQRKLHLKPENIIVLKALRNFWLNNKYLISDFDPANLYFFDPVTYQSTRYRNNENNFIYQTSEEINLLLSKSDSSEEGFRSSNSSGSTNFSGFSFHSLGSMTDPFEEFN